MFIQRLSSLGAVVALQYGLLGHGPLHAQQQAQPAQSGAADVLFACRQIADDRERLVCYDREVGALAKAEANDNVLIVDKEDIRKARRDLFGFTLPRIALFDGGNDKDDKEKEEIRQIDDALTSFRITPTGRAAFTLANGASWTQVDNLPILGEPKPGDPVRIERAALGSFKASIGGRRAIKVKRIN
jgi:hypothetical protein